MLKEKGKKERLTRKYRSRKVVIHITCVTCKWEEFDKQIKELTSDHTWSWKKAPEPFAPGEAEFVLKESVQACSMCQEWVEEMSEREAKDVLKKMLRAKSNIFTV